MFLSFICFSKLVIFVNTGQLVENNTSYARDIQKVLTFSRRRNRVLSI